MRNPTGRKALLALTLALTPASLALLTPTAAHAQGRAGGETEEERVFAEAEDLFERARYEDAARLYDRAIALNGSRVASYVKRATIHFRDRRYDDAIDLLRRAERLSPQDLDVKTVLGLCLFLSRTGEDRAAGLRYLEDVAARRPESYEAQLQVGLHYAPRDPARGIAALEQYLRYRPEERRGTDPVAQVALGEAYLRGGRVADAVPVLDAAFKARPQDLRGRLLLGAALVQRGDCARAAPLHEAVLGEINDRPRIAYNLALCYVRLGRGPEAARLAERYAALRPEDPRGALLLGDIALAQGDARAALRHYEDGERLCRGREATQMSVAARLARAQLALRNPARAVSLAEARLAQLTPGAGTPEEGELLAVLIEAQLRTGARGTQLAENASRLGQLAPRDPAALALAGSAALAAGNLERARRLYGEALAQDPKQRRARVGLARALCRQALAEESRGARAAALPLLEQAVPLDDGPTSARNLAVLYLAEGRAADAERVMTAALATPELRSEPTLLRLRSRALIAEGRGGQALSSLEKAASEALRRLSAAQPSERAELQVLLSELDVELGARFLVGGRLDEAIEVLEAALRDLPAGSDARRPALRDVSLAYLYRGRQRLHESEDAQAAGTAGATKQAEEALGDLQKALERKGLEPGRRETGAALCSAALAAVQATRYGVARELSQRALSEGGCDLAPPYDRLGAELIGAFANYRDSGNSAQREQAQRALTKLLGRLPAGAAAPTATTANSAAPLLRSLLRSTGELLAFDYYSQGPARTPRALQLLRAAQKLGDDAVLQHNLAVIELQDGRGGGERVLERLAPKVPEATLNLAILAERRGDVRRALELFRKAQERGLKSPRLREWIETKEKLLGGGEGQP